MLRIHTIRIYLIFIIRNCQGLSLIALWLGSDLWVKERSLAIHLAVLHQGLFMHLKPRETSTLFRQCFVRFALLGDLDLVKQTRKSSSIYLIMTALHLQCQPVCLSMRSPQTKLRLPAWQALFRVASCLKSVWTLWLTWRDAWHGDPCFPHACTRCY